MQLMKWSKTTQPLARFVLAVTSSSTAMHTWIWRAVRIIVTFATKGTLIEGTPT
ncbi:hypothetical protein DUNSADRAFT_13359 [Dunaliella salina]|uniref:Encoded protein n=1 Tax=Dunaliella salina TaxID=3046 RepID=A0ABQ7FR53_DUNSA|nr:hypothetical protein DUNSADRAFT_13359 [Dunaliella salina]|eukprot:KAF5825231.1 hypothetical protein DUNSADRAFT_13359 [Dunaliella salina]